MAALAAAGASAAETKESAAERRDWKEREDFWEVTVSERVKGRLVLEEDGAAFEGLEEDFAEDLAESREDFDFLSLGFEEEFPIFE